MPLSIENGSFAERSPSKSSDSPVLFLTKQLSTLSSRVAYGAFLNRVFVLAVMVAVGIVIGAFVTLVIFFGYGFCVG